ncbi:MAG TPA: ATP-binding cassette domain-containing protein, partial [Actinomycetota bacterium]|nr:ATP-binding cassette domain-containing protein [Actinomycetota bacterium]
LLHQQPTLHALDRATSVTRGETLLETVGLTGAADRRVGTYSGGMRRRLDLALSLIHEPVVLFLDEPTTGLDPNSRFALWDELRKLNRESGTTVFLTTQYMEEADTLAGRVAIIDEGRIVAEGSPAQLKAKVGDPTLQVTLASGQDPIEAESVLMAFGEPAGAGDNAISVRLEGGAGRMEAVVRALDEARVAVEGIELHLPTLDDVFQDATGRRLEGAADAVSLEAESARSPRQ